MLKKSSYVMATATTLVAIMALPGFAVPPTPQPLPAKKTAERRELLDMGSQIPNPNAARNSSAPLCETTGFEAAGACNFDTLGNICGSAYTNCPASGPTVSSCTGNPLVDQDCCSAFPNPLNGWWNFGPNKFCNSPAISNIHPSEGEQHLRFEHDALGGTTPGCNGFASGSGCLVNALMGDVSLAFQPAPNRVDMTFDVSMSATPFGIDVTGNLEMLAVGDAANGGGGLVPLVLYFSYYGLLFVYDYQPYYGFRFAGYLTGDSNYDAIRVEFDICNEEVRYFINDIPTYTGSTVGGGDRWNRASWLYDNIPGNTWDLDNLVTTRYGACPSVCGDGVIESLEECEPGADESNCPGRCGAAGGPDECVCSRPCNNCELPCEVNNGLNGPYLTDGGLYSYTADSPFTSIDTCGSDYDTVIFWNLFANCGDQEMINDECNELDALLGQDAGDPSASCFVNTGGGPPFQAEDFPLDSCLCAATTPGQSYAFAITEYGGTEPALGGSHVINIRKKTACGSPILGGACCDGLTGVCEDGVSAMECSGEFDTYTEGKLCTTMGVTCEAILGACCDSSPGAGGACSDTIQADCDADWTPGVSCSTLQPQCAEVQGACCNALLGSCSVTLQAACNCADCSWTEGATCGSIVCNPIQGACCEQTQESASCTQTSQAGCNCENCTWTRETDCEDVTCDPLFTPIPTVSEWGLVIMALLLLVGGKVYFGRRQTALA